MDMASPNKETVVNKGEIDSNSSDRDSQKSFGSSYAEKEI
jgi:hypothetical protein